MRERAPPQGSHMNTQLQHLVERSHGASSPNKLVNHMCLCVYFFFFSLTWFSASLSAPAPNKSSTVVVCPQREAKMSAV